MANSPAPHAWAKGNAVAGQVRPRIVVADDHPGMLDEIFRLLTPEFEVVRTVRHGQELLEAARKLSPDAVISDIHMPVMDGIYACERLLEAGFAGALILLTMHAERELVDRAFRVGIRAYVLKIDASEDLIPAIYAALDGRDYYSRSVLKHK